MKGVVIMSKEKYLLMSASILLVLSVLSFQSSSGQGDLTPPDTPAPTMKTLQEVYDKAKKRNRTPRLRGLKQKRHRIPALPFMRPIFL